MNSQLFVAVSTCVLVNACVLPAQQTPLVDLQVGAATQYIHRGMVQNEHGVLQGEMDVGLQTKDGGALDLIAWGNIDLTDDPGDAWFPDGNQGRFSEIDFKAIYSRAFTEANVAFGLVSYVVPKGDQFPNGERGETSELFASVSRDFSGWVPELALHYDFDEVEDLYVETACSRSFEVSEKVGAEARAHLGWSGSDQSLWTYGVDASGFADLGVELTLAYFLDETTTLRAFIAGSTMVDSEIADWFDLIGIEKDNVWVGVSATWSY